MVGYPPIDQRDCMTNIPTLEAWCQGRRKQNHPRQGELAQKCPISFWALLWLLWWVNQRPLVKWETLERSPVCQSRSPDFISARFITCSSPPSQLLGTLKAVVAEAADWLAFSHLASDVSAKCFRGPLGDLHCAKKPFLFLPPAPSLTAHSAPSEGIQESQWGRRGLWSPTRQCLFLYPLGPEVTGWGGAEMTSAPGPTSLSLKSSSLSRTRKEVWSLLAEELSESCSLPPCSNGFCLDRTR